MAKHTQNLNEVKTGNFLSWIVCSQNWYTATIRILDNDTVYATIYKSSYSTAFT